MKMRIFALPGGQLQVFVDEGTFAEAKAATEEVLARLNALGLPVELVGQIEQHKNEVSHVHVLIDMDHTI